MADSSFWDVPFIVVDVETTGPDGIRNRIMDFAAVTTIGGEITDEYSSLINPHQYIPPYIISMTGITYKMAFNAPEPEEILPQARKLFNREGAVFVAHNASFDWQFVNQSFKNFKLESISVPKLCTLKLARRLITKAQKKNLGALSEYFGIKIKDRHRALGDAHATALILVELLGILESEHDITTLDELLVFQNKTARQFKPPEKTWARVEPILETLPDEPGVYYFSDSDDKLMYVGKAKSLKERVKSYFSVEAVLSKKIAAMVKRVHNIRWECTETELAALLMESREIKRLQPPVNVMEKAFHEYPFVRITNEELPRIEVCSSIEDDGAEYYGPFKSRRLTEQLVETIKKQFRIRKCDGPRKYAADHKPCFYSHIEGCFAPCSDADSTKKYIEEVEKVRRHLSGYSDGAVAILRKKMLEHSENLEFEKAALIKAQIAELSRLLDRRISGSASVNEANYIMIIPASVRYRTLQLFYVRSGSLRWQATIGRKADLGEILQQVDEIFGDPPQKLHKFSPEEINELKIITSWTYRLRESARFVYSADTTLYQMKQEIEATIRNFRFEDETEPEIQIGDEEGFVPIDQDNPFVD